ncbi:MAG: GspH/FimT family pseudopilin, partial [Gallionella sp.]|nr:GspH/FimT family pseudopilin [Gallionella sp.]
AFSKSRHLGFSLIELMIGVVILAILMSLAVPSFQAWLQNTQIRNAAESIQNGLQRARAAAVGRNTDVEFVLTAGSSWTIRVVSSGEVIESRSGSEGSKSVSLTALDAALASATTVTFNNLGSVKAANADASAPFTQVDLDSSVLAPADSQELRVTIGFGGNVRMCDPNAPAGSPRAC